MKTGTIGSIAILAIMLAAAAGWVMNVIEIVKTVSDPVGGMFILRCLGVFLAPLGAVLGYF